jgi:hypothetical protein
MIVQNTNLRAALFLLLVIVFAQRPDGDVRQVHDPVRGLWAPDISYFNGKYHLTIPFPHSASIIPASVSQPIKLSIP